MTGLDNNFSQISRIVWRCQGKSHLLFTTRPHIPEDTKVQCNYVLSQGPQKVWFLPIKGSQHFLSCKYCHRLNSSLSLLTGCHEIQYLKAFISFLSKLFSLVWGEAFKQEIGSLSSNVVENESEKWQVIYWSQVKNICRFRASPEHVMLDEEGISPRLEDKVLHKGLRRVVISLNREWI